uniref:Transposase n=1 Tax=Steinernema glaseri TaxID=37863 RepID=A0A1I7ZFP4_9BILA
MLHRSVYGYDKEEIPNNGRLTCDLEDRGIEMIRGIGKQHQRTVLGLTTDVGSSDIYGGRCWPPGVPMVSTQC